MMGVSNFDWKASGSTILPGAIFEHFTSSGGDFRTNGDHQTTLTEFLRFGAAAASGTVTEPFAVLNKFPLPMMQVHYARGCTVAESFYQAVLSPYQLLIVGDPLCRPWANIPEITCTGLAANETVHDEIHVNPTARFAGKTEAEHFEMILDDFKVRECLPGTSLDFDTSYLSDGIHEVRVVAASKGPIPARGEMIIPFVGPITNGRLPLAARPRKLSP